MMQIQHALAWGILMMASLTPGRLWLAPLPVEVEVCDNARDDDGDGLIDLNDPDCDCPPAAPLSLIPNPSFEEQECCPGNNSQMYCTQAWIQASVPTTDFIHTCGYLGWSDYPAPQPFPDGQGCIGFRDGRPGTSGNDYQSNWKEYAGVCLTDTLHVGEYYRLEFQVGFSQPQYSPPFNLAIYGNTACSSLPFDEEDAAFGCPTNDVFLGWVELGKVRVSGINQWKSGAIEFTPSKDITAFVIGPGCERVLSPEPLYYFLDQLVLAKKEDFTLDISAEGNACTGEEMLQVPPVDTLNFQWYRNGVALLGETDHQLKGPLRRGAYRVRATGISTCFLTEEFFFSVPFEYTRQEVDICPGEEHFFRGQIFSESGTYYDTLKSAGNCDSIVELRLKVLEEAADTVYQGLFGSETYSNGEYFFDEPGEYLLSFKTTQNCDSLILLQLDRYRAYVPDAFSPNGDGINDFFTIQGDENLESVPLFQVYNRWGGRVFSATDLNPLQGWDGREGSRLASPGVYIYKARLLFRDEKERIVTGSVTLVR